MKFDINFLKESFKWNDENKSLLFYPFFLYLLALISFVATFWFLSGYVDKVGQTQLILISTMICAVFGMFMVVVTNTYIFKRLVEINKTHKLSSKEITDSISHGLMVGSTTLIMPLLQFSRMNEHYGYGIFNFNAVFMSVGFAIIMLIFVKFSCISDLNKLSATHASKPKDT